VAVTVRQGGDGEGEGRLVGKSCTLPLLDRLSMLAGLEVGAHWERMSRCQGVKVTSETSSILYA
jgi:hypothetical protein